MKALIIIINSIFLSTMVMAGIGGSGGGAADGIIQADVYQFYTTQVCQTDESGSERGCRMITFKRKQKPTTVSPDTLICSGEAQNTVCDRPYADVPEVLERINKWFVDLGYDARQAPEDANTN